MGYGTFATARLLKHWQPERNLLLLPAENVVRVILIGVCLALGLLSGVGNRALGWIFVFPIRQLAVGVLFGLGVGLFFYFVTSQLVKHTGQRFYSSSIIEYITPQSTKEFLWTLPAMAIVVLVEELLFRSLLLGGLTPILPTWVLLLGFGILFGAFHSPQGVWGMVGAGAGGVFLSVLFLCYGSLLAPLVAHYVVNVFQVAMAMRGKVRSKT